MDRDDGGRERPFDFLGFGALILFIGGLQLMLDRGPSQDWFDSPEVWTELALSLVGLYIFVVQTLTAEHPFFHRDLAKDRNFVATTLFMFCTGALLFSITALLPTLMQNLMGFSVLQSGYASMPRGLGSFVSFLLTPMLMARFGSRPVLIMGIVISLYAVWTMTQFDLSMTADPIMLSGLIQGLGMGLLFAPLNTLAYVTLAPAHRTEGTIITTISRTLGSSVGISLMQAKLIGQSAIAHSVLAGHIQPSDPVITAALPAVMNPNTSVGLQVLNGEVTRQGAMIAYDSVFSWILVIIVCLFPLLMMIRPPRAAPTLTPIEVAHE